MKKLLPLLLSLLLLAGCATTYDGPTVEKEVLSEVEYTYYDQNGNITAYGSTKYAYDIYGNVAQTIEYMNDEPVRRTDCRYDEADNIIKQTDYDLGGWFPKRVNTAVYTYDDQGRLTSSTHRQGFEKSTVTYAYDDENRTQTATLSDGSQTVQYRDEAGLYFCSEHTAANGDVLRNETERSEDGRRQTNRYYVNGVLETVTEYTYDDQGRLLTWTETENGETHTVFRYEYGENYDIRCDEDGSKITTSYRDDGKIQYVLRTDAHDNITEDTYYRYTEIQIPDGEVTP